MSLTPSTMMPLGTPAPDFSLPDTVSGKTLSYSDVAGDRATVVMFICNHCPYVIHVNDELVRVANDYRERGVGFVAISANDVGSHPQDAPERMTQVAEELGYPFPYLYDESQETAKAYDAACTPDFFVFDNEQKCTYRGRLDGSTPGNDVPLTGEDLRGALDTILAGDQPGPDQKPSQGCNIKWKG